MCYSDIVLVNLALNGETDAYADSSSYCFYAPVAGYLIPSGRVTLADRDVGHWSSEAEGEYFTLFILFSFCRQQ